MTIQASTARLSFPCNGVSTIFPVNIQAYNASDFLVLATNAAGSIVLTLNSDYTLAASGSLTPPFWSLTTLTGQLVSPFATGYTLQVILNPAETQLSQYTQGQAFPSLAVQTNLDRLTQMAIRQSDILARAIVAPDGDVSPVMALPAAALRASKNLGFDPSGNLVVNLALASGTISTATLAPFLNLLQTPAEFAAGVTPVNLAYLPGIIERYGTNTTPFVTSMTAAMQAAINQARIGGGADVIVGTTGGVLIDGPLDLTTPVGSTRYVVTIRGVRNLAAFTNNSPYYPTILLKHTGIGFDNTGCAGVNLENLSIGTDLVTYPKIGILLARNTDAQSQQARFFNVQVLGNFKVAALYNYGSEDSEQHGCQFWNFAQDFSNGGANTGAKSMVFTGTNYLYGITSTFTTILGNGASHLISTQDHKFFGGTYYSNRGSPNLSGVQITGTAGQFSCNASNFYVGQPIAITGAFGGTGSITGYLNPTVYFVSATNGTTAFTLVNAAGAALVTTAGTPTGLTYGAQSSDAIYLDSVSNFRMYAPWGFAGQTGVNPGRSFLYIDTKLNPSNGITIDALMLENQIPQQQNFGIFVGNEAAQNNSVLMVKGGLWSANVAQMYNSAASNYSNINWFNNPGQATPSQMINDGTLTNIFADLSLAFSAGAGTVSRSIAGFTYPISVQSPGDSYISLQDPNAGANAKVWNIRNVGGALNFTLATDGNVNTSTGFVFTRSGTTPTLFEIGCAMKIDGNVGFNGNAALAKPTITGSKGANAALASLLTALNSYGLILDSTT